MGKIGVDNKGYEHVTGKHGLGRVNENKQRLADFCAFNNVVIGDSIFPLKDIHRATWWSTDHVTKKQQQIDHVCMGKSSDCRYRT